ncbi:MAG: DUF3575 domain-containing protein [Paludibacteraceae bacterium]|nr:DUF3575 domain-containing protein [Paludibacteraceae bacterium]
MKKTIIYILFLIFGCASLHAQFERSVVIYFDKNSSELDLDLRDNDHSLRLILDSLNVFNSDSVYKIKSITFSGAASPDGSRAYNNRLAERRARSVFKYIADYAPLPDSIQAVQSLGRDWSGLIRLAQDDPNLPHRDYVMELLNTIATGADGSLGGVDPLQRLMRVNDGEVYKYMLDNLFPLLRATYLNISYEKISKSDYDVWASRMRSLEDIVFVPVEQPVDTTPAEPVDTVVPEPQPEPEPQPVETVAEAQDSLLCRPFYMAVKSNMLFDAAMTPNAGIEFYLGAGFSLSANWQYAWWKRDKSAFYWRTYGGDVEARYWFGKAAKEKPLTGHHVGLYGQLFTYDFEFGGKGLLAPKWSWAAGASYGYSLPIHRVLNIDFVVGAGYHTGIYYEYIPIDGEYVWQATKRRHWIGPTKAEVTLVWLIGCDNYNRNPKFDKKQQEKVQATINALVGEDKGGVQ